MNIDDLVPVVQQALWKRMEGRQRLMPKNLLENIGKDIGVHPHDVRRVFSRLKEIGWLNGVGADGRPFASVTILAERPVKEEPEALLAWRDVLLRVGVSIEDKQALEGFHEALAGFSASDLDRIAQGLLDMRREIQDGVCEPQFIASARHLLASSKLVGQLPRSGLRAFCPEIDQQSEQIPYLVTAGPPNPQSVILIENPWAFERAVQAGLSSQHALIVTFGYGLSRNSEAFGRQLAGMIENSMESLIQLRRDGTPPKLSELFSHPNLCFWGDLDPEGFRIYLRLKRRLPQLELSVLYDLMAEVLNAGGGHPYVVSTGKSGQLPLSDTELDLLTPTELRYAVLCAHRGVDQETVPVEHMQTVLRSKPITKG